MDKYYIRARLLPTILTALPLIAVYNFIVSPLIAPYLEGILPYLPAIGNVTLSTAIVFFLVQVNRTLSKYLLQMPIFKDELNMPTTNFLLLSDDEYPPYAKNKLREKIKTKFSIDLPDTQEEANDEPNARKQIVFSVGQIKASLYNDPIILNHNIEYGAIRNFLGGCIQAVVFSLVLLIYIYNIRQSDGLRFLGYFFLVIYGLFLAASKWLINTYGKNYARILFQQFLAS